MRNPQQIIGQAWTGRHVVILQCSETNKLIKVYKSYHAPIEPPRFNCAETLSQLLSIGYRIHAMAPLPNQRIQYVLVLF
ncbi:hypothetical protein WQ54_29755 [Bacillus sp. SA1-12]|uniref:hypothetical protein n=1 Tax=Bacillus sp. SA1-12 TaxID=1455638 RepID=UPI0006271F78|nr:hypothetical protein [Bacillus sp. SA1-12]KKI88701.1 hypothetical protein WQ54_29755 [Bacillus sp. SA1-12]